MPLDMQPLCRDTDKLVHAEFKNINPKPMASLNEDIHARSRKKRERLTRLRLEIEHQSSENHELQTTITEEQGHELKTTTTEEQGHDQTFDLLTDDSPVEESNKIRQNLPFLKDELVPDNFITTLYSDGILTDEQQQHLKATMNELGRGKCCEELLLILARSYPKSYERFCWCLKDENYFLALQKLQPNTDITQSELDRSRGKMPEPEYGKIKGNIKMLKEGIYPGDYITHLFEKKVLTDDEYERLKTMEKRPMACVEAMLYIVLRCGQYGFRELMLYMKKENPSLVRKLYPDNSTSYCDIKYPNENHEVILDLEREEHTEFKNRTTKYLEETLNTELPGKQLVSIRSVTKGCVQVTFEILSLNKTDKDKLQAVLEEAVKSGNIGPDAVAEKFTFENVEDDTLTDAEVEEEIRRLEEVKQILIEEHDHLLNLRKNPTSAAAMSSRNWYHEILQQLRKIEEDINMLYIMYSNMRKSAVKKDDKISQHIERQRIMLKKESPSSPQESGYYDEILQHLRMIEEDIHMLDREILHNPPSSWVKSDCFDISWHLRLINQSIQKLETEIFHKVYSLKESDGFHISAQSRMIEKHIQMLETEIFHKGSSLRESDGFHISWHMRLIEEKIGMLRKMHFYNPHSSREESAVKKDETSKHLEKIEEDIGKLEIKMVHKPLSNLEESVAQKAEILQKLYVINRHIYNMRRLFHDLPSSSSLDKSAVQKDEMLKSKITKEKFSEYEKSSTLKDDTSPEDTSSIESKDI